MATLIRFLAPLAVAAAAFAATLAVGGAQIAEHVIVALAPADDGGAAGSAVLSAVGNGTSVELALTGLTAGGSYAVKLHAGTCDAPSASFSDLPGLTANAGASATANGAILFRGTDPVALETMTDGEHVIVIAGDAGVVACGVIPVAAVGPAATGNGGLAGAPAGQPLILALAGLAGVVAVAFAARRFTARHRR